MPIQASAQQRTRNTYELTFVHLFKDRRGYVGHHNIFEPQMSAQFGHSLADQYHLKEKHENSDTSDQRKTQTSARPSHDIVANYGGREPHGSSLLALRFARECSRAYLLLGLA